jgi:hypothetical protein
MGVKQTSDRLWGEVDSSGSELCPVAGRCKHVNNGAGNFLMTSSTATISVLTQGRLKGRVSRTAARGANLQGTLEHHWNKYEIWR